VEKELPYFLLLKALLSIRAGEGLRPAFEVEEMRCVAFLKEEICGENFLPCAFRELPEIRTEPHFGSWLEEDAKEEFFVPTGIP